MTRIDFYFNVENKFRHIATLAERALQRQRRLMIMLPDQHPAELLETQLWTHQPTSFLPHCRTDHPLSPDTPIVIGWENSPLVHDDILINLTPTQPTCFTRFKGLIELVSQDTSDREAARARYRFYRDLGYDIRSHDSMKA